MVLAQADAADSYLFIVRCVSHGARLTAGWKWYKRLDEPISIAVIGPAGIRFSIRLQRMLPIRKAPYGHDTINYRVFCGFPENV